MLEQMQWGDVFIVNLQSLMNETNVNFRSAQRECLFTGIYKIPFALSVYNLFSPQLIASALLLSGKKQFAF